MKLLNQLLALIAMIGLAMPTTLRTLPTYAAPRESNVSVSAPQTANEPEALVIQKVVANRFNFCFLTQAGSVYCWGSSILGLGNYGGQPTLVQGAASGIKDLALGGRHACVLTTSGGVKCWGRNSDGQLGNGKTSFFGSQTLTDVVGLSSGVSAIAAGDDTSCAVKTDGVPYCWGDNDHGQLGIGTTQVMSVPVMVTNALSNVMALDTGDHTCAVTTSGATWCWGRGIGVGDGDRTFADKKQPVPLSGLSSGVLTIDTSADGTCAVVSGGGVKCWGQIVGSVVPTDVVGLTSGVSQVSVAGFHLCARLQNGSAKCWGSNDAGQLGDGTFTDRFTTSVDVAGISNVTYVVAGDGLDDGASCAVIGGNAMKCWGANQDNRLANGDEVFRSTPAEVPNLNGVIAVGLGFSHTCAVVNPGIVKCWGRGEFGELGSTGGKYELSPITVTLTNPPVVLAGINQISTSGGENCVLSASAVTCWGLVPPKVNLLTSIPTQISTGDHTCVLIGGVSSALALTFMANWVTAQPPAAITLG